jgi:hypothetical protein
VHITTFTCLNGGIKNSVGVDNSRDLFLILIWLPLQTTVIKDKNKTSFVSCITGWFMHNHTQTAQQPFLGVSACADAKESLTVQSDRTVTAFLHQPKFGK